MKLNQLKPGAGSRQARHRVGRGIVLTQAGRDFLGEARVHVLAGYVYGLSNSK